MQHGDAEPDLHTGSGSSPNVPAQTGSATLKLQQHSIDILRGYLMIWHQQEDFVNSIVCGGNARVHKFYQVLVPIQVGLD